MLPALLGSPKQLLFRVFLIESLRDNLPVLCANFPVLLYKVRDDLVEEVVFFFLPLVMRQFEFFQTDELEEASFCS